MDLLTKPVCLSRAEYFVNWLDSNWKGTEGWVTDWAMKIHGLHKKLKESLEKFPLSDHIKFYVPHYHSIGMAYLTIYEDHKVNLYSVNEWLEKCSNAAEKITVDTQMAYDVKCLKEKVSDELNRINKEKERLHEKLLKEVEGGDDQFVETCVALGNFSGNTKLKKAIESMKDGINKWEQVVENILLLRLIVLMEDFLTSCRNDNLLIISRILGTLSNAYRLAGLEALVTQHKNLSKNVLESCLTSKIDKICARQNVKNLIAMHLSNKTSCNNVKNVIENEYGQKLSIIDESYIESKYIKLCQQLFIEESTVCIHDLIKNKNRQPVMRIYLQLNSASTLNQIAEPFNKLQYFSLLMQHYNLLKVHESDLLRCMKNECFKSMADEICLAKKELEFYKKMVTYLGSIKNTKDIESGLNLRYFCTSTCSIEELINKVMALKCEYYSEGLTEVQTTAEPLQDEKELFYVEEFKEFILGCIAPPQIQKKELDGRQVLEVSGKKIVLSEIFGQSEFLKILEDASTEEVRLIGTNVIHVDENAIGRWWEGKNLVVYTKTIYIHGNICWNVSGCDGTDASSSDAGTSGNGCGMMGEDGTAGESGGNVLILADNIVNSGEWTIMSLGGDGGDGQNGGNGKDGIDGMSIEKHDFEKKFPPVASFWAIKRDKLLLTTMQNIKECSSEIKCKWYGRPVTDVSRYIPGSDVYRNLIASDSFCEEKNLDNIIADLEKSMGSIHNIDHFRGNIYVEAVTAAGNEIIFSSERGDSSTNCQAFLLFRGTNGEIGCVGGEGGMSGEGGYGGEVIIQDFKGASSSYRVSVTNNDGKNGKNGNGGLQGTRGKNGWDMGYLDYSISGLFTSTWPKYFGLERDSKIKLRYCEADNGSRVWCPYRRHKNCEEAYATMEPFSNELAKYQLYQERAECDANREQKSHSKAIQKKTISIDNVQSTYHLNITAIEHLLSDETFSILSHQAEFLNKQHQERLAVNAKVKRCAEYSNRDVKHHSQEHENIKCEYEQPSAGSVIDSVTKNPLSIKSWMSMKNTEMTRHQLDQLLILFQSTFENQKALNSNVLKEDNCDSEDMVSALLREKYSVASLLEFSDALGEITNPKVDCEQSLSPTEVVKYLRVVDVVECEFFEDRLGSLKQYLFTDNLEARQEIGRFLIEEAEEAITVDGHINFRNFVLETGQWDGVSQKIRNYFQKYQQIFSGRMTLYDSATFLNMLHKLDEKCQSDDEMVSYYTQTIIEKGCQLNYYIELLGLIFDVNIRMYEEGEGNQQMLVLKGNFNSNCSSHIQVLRTVNECQQLMIDDDFLELEMRREKEGLCYLKILNDTKLFTEVTQFHNYVDTLESITKEVALNEIEVFFRGLVIEEMEAIDKITKHFHCIEEKVVMGSRLQKLSSNYIGETGVLEYIAKRFSIEGKHITALELHSLINSILDAYANGSNSLPLYLWIFAASPQKLWIGEALLVEIEEYFKKPLPQKQKWKQYLKQIDHTNVLLSLGEKLKEYNRSENLLSVDCIDEVFHFLQMIPENVSGLEQLGLTEWLYVLKEKYWTSKLTKLLNWGDGDKLSLCTYYILSIENIYSSEFLDYIMDILLKHNQELTTQLLLHLFCNLYQEKWDLGSDELETLSNCNCLPTWVKEIDERFRANERDRDLSQLVYLIQSNANTSSNIKESLRELEGRLNVVFDASYHSSISLLVLPEATPISSYVENDINEWVSALKAELNSFDNSIERNHHIMRRTEEIIAMIDRAVELKRGFRLRDTQRLATYILLGGKNTLAQVSTGEGKSLIVVAASIVKALGGEKVDIITSSSVLAKRDAENNSDIYHLFGINVSHNCSEDIEIRKSVYSGNQVVYGELSDFQRDYLLHEFYGKNILGDRTFENVVIDEVDCMLLDKGNNMLYLSHDLPGLDKLESLYIFIWQWINRPCVNEGDISHAFNMNKIKEAVLYDLYGYITLEDVKSCNVKMTNQDAAVIWEQLIDSNIIDRFGRPLIDIVDSSKIMSILHPNFTNLNNRLCYLIQDCLTRDKLIQVPNTIKPFVESHLDVWIKNAITAYFMKAGEDYVVDVDRTGMSADRNPNITIIDRETGTDQANSQWEEALHQFLQLKHGCKLSVLSLKAVFISNVSYFKQYSKLYGLTGTLGSLQDRALLQEVHKVDFVTIPTAKAKQFTEDMPILCSDDKDWIIHIGNVMEEKVSRGRSVLVICESVNDVKMLHQSFEGKASALVHTYTRDYEKFDITNSREELEPGHIILATNLAGRGTDIKINDKLRSAGGLHIILSYLPSNLRTEQQAFGRAARCGDKGTGQLITRCHFPQSNNVSRILDLKKNRNANELERISKVKNQYYNQICVEEKCFQQFTVQYNLCKQMLNRGHIGNETLVPEEFHDFDHALNHTILGQRPKRISPDIEELLLRTCIDKWAYWLDKLVKLMKDPSSPMAHSSNVNHLMNQFINEMKILLVETNNNLACCVENYPAQMVKLGKCYIKCQKFKDAIELFDKVIKLEPQFSESAHYYKAFALGKMIDWEKSVDTDDVRTLERELLEAAKLFEEHGSHAISNAGIVSKLRRSNKQSIIQIEAYEEQQKSIANLYQLFSHSIQNILGHSVTPQSFVTYEINEITANGLFNSLLGSKILKPLNLSSLAKTDSAMENLCCGYNIPLESFKAFLKEHEAKPINNFRAFNSSMKNKINLPSKEKFWKELIDENILHDEIKYVIVDVNKLSEIDPSLLNTLIDSERCKKLMEQEKCQLFLNVEQIPEQNKNECAFVKSELISHIGRERFLTLKKRGVLSFNRKCGFQYKTLQAAAFSYRTTSLQNFTDANIGNDEAKSITAHLMKKNVISNSDTTDEFIIIGQNYLIDEVTDKLDSVHKKKVKSLLKTYSGKCSFTLSSFDSIAEHNFTRHNVSLKDSEDILEQLVKQHVVCKSEMNPGSYHLLIHFNDIDHICLSLPVYENLTKSLLKTCFANRIALQKLVSHIEEQRPSISLQLKTKPYSALFWNLYDMGVIVPVKVSTEGKLKDCLNNTFQSKFDRKGIHNLFSQGYLLQDDDFEELLSHLEQKGWIRNCPNWVPGMRSEFEITKPVNKRNGLDEKFKGVEKTLEKICDNCLKLSSDNSIANVSHTLERLKSKLDGVKVPYFNLKPLIEVCGEGDFSSIEELYIFSMNGLDEILSVEEKKYTLEMWLNVSIVVCMGVCQIVIGAVIDMYSVGAMTYVGNAFMNEGISDILFALSAARSGYFRWEDYRTHKIESVALTAVTAGIGAFYSRGTKLSRIGQQLSAPGAQIGERAVAQTVGAQVLKKAEASIGKQLVKQVALKTIEGVGFGVANIMVDSVAENFLQTLCQGISSDITSSMDCEVENHKIESVIKKVYESIGEVNAKTMIFDVTQQFLQKTSAWEQFGSISGKIFSSVSRGISEAAHKKMKAGQSTSKFQIALQTINKIVVWGQRANHLIEIRQMTVKMLDGLAVDIVKKLDELKPSTHDIAMSQIDYVRFKHEIIQSWKSTIREKSGNIISHHIIIPILKDGAYVLVSYTGRKVKDFYRSYKEEGYSQLFQEYKQQYQNEIENAGDDIDVKNKITTQYHENLLKLLAKTRNPTLFSDIVRENIPMDMTCLDACIKMLPYILHKQGITENVKIIVEKEGDDVKQVFESGQNGAEKVIRLRLKGNHFPSQNSNGSSGLNASGLIDNNCLYHALSEQCDLGMTDSEFRESVAKIIEEDRDMHYIVRQGWHKYGISLSMYGGRDHSYAYRRSNIDYWELDDTKDLDLVEGKWEKDENGNDVWVEKKMCASELNEQRTKAFNEALQKINKYLNEIKHPKEKNIDLRPEDFQASTYDTVRISINESVDGQVLLYPVEIEGKIQIKVKGEGVVEYDLNINLDTINKPMQRGPQGPHVGYDVIRKGQRKGKNDGVTGHCLINKTGNERMPYRTKRNLGNQGGVYCVKTDQIPSESDLSRVPIYKLFDGPDDINSTLERDSDRPNYYF